MIDLPLQQWKRMKLLQKVCIAPPPEVRVMRHTEYDEQGKCAFEIELEDGKGQVFRAVPDEFLEELTMDVFTYADLKAAVKLLEDSSLPKQGGEP